MNYIRLQVICPQDFTEILLAEIAEAGFNTFMENEKGFEAFGEENKVEQEAIKKVELKYAHLQPLIFFQEKIQKQNWNKEWEKNVDPVIVEDRCLIRAEFHKVAKKYPYEIVITPKMSFGTGHHATTYLMLKEQMTLDHQDKLVMDAGCGTAILSIMASKRGARAVEAFDIDDWSISNGMENMERNNCSNISLRQGTIRSFKWKENFDIILANINKNILIDEMPSYRKHLVQGGQLVLSGFYVQDNDELKKVAAKNGFAPASEDQRESWSMIRLQRVK